MKMCAHRATLKTKQTKNQLHLSKRLLKVRLSQTQTEKDTVSFLTFFLEAPTPEYSLTSAQLCKTHASASCFPWIPTAIPHTQLFNQFLCACPTCLLSRSSQAVKKFGTQLIRKKKDSFLQSLIRKSLGVGLPIEYFRSKKQIKTVFRSKMCGQREEGTEE